jgi:hypothetical protein
MRTMLSMSAILAITLLACGPGHPPSPPPQDVKSKTTPGTRPTPTKKADGQEEIVGEVDRIPAEPKRRRMVIWGKVQRIIEKKHDQLPEAKPISTGGVGDPVTEIKNGTSFNLTLYFAGKCAHHTKVPPMGKVTAVFCPGTYNIAAVVDNQDYLPLVRQDQKFEGGVSYLLQVVVKQRPQ